MKFRDPNSGEVFEDIDTAVWRECKRREICNAGCPLFDLHKRSACRDYVILHPVEVALRMGYEVVEDRVGDTNKIIEGEQLCDAAKLKEGPMRKTDKPLRECGKCCIANVGGQCAVEDCGGAIVQMHMGQNSTLEISARYYQYMRAYFDDYFWEGYTDDDTVE